MNNGDILFSLVVSLIVVIASLVIATNWIYGYRNSLVRGTISIILFGIIITSTLRGPSLYDKAPYGVIIGFIILIIASILGFIKK